MIPATITLIIAAINTAPAETSFISPALVLNSGWSRSMVFSMEVFINSKANTRAIHKQTAIHSR